MPSIGIDLGTTYSCVGVWSNQRVEIVANEQGNRTTPSCVAFTDEEQLVGNAAVNQSARNLKNTVFDAKRLLGLPFSDPIVQEEIKRLQVNVIDVEGKPHIKVTHLEEEKIFTPEEISSVVLKQMKTVAESFTSAPIDSAVITVPAYFTEDQRNATKLAATQAGLKVTRLINEPTAVAIAYGLDKPHINENVIIFDLGSTFDVTLLAVEDGIFSVKATARNSTLGGHDFDTKLVDHFRNEFKRKNRGLDLSGNPRSMYRLRVACERAKRTLSVSSKASVELDALFDGVDHYSSITRSLFESCCGPLFREILAPVQKVLSDSGIEKENIAKVILVGGSTMIPKIQTILKDFFGKAPVGSITPDEAVAFGATMQAAVLEDVSDNLLNEVLSLDVTPKSVGIETSGGVMTPVIKKGSALPSSKTINFSTFEDNQSAVLVQVYEGEEPATKDNTLLAKLKLDLEPAPKGTPEISVTYDFNGDGVLTVTVKEATSGKENKITLHNDGVKA